MNFQSPENIIRLIQFMLAPAVMLSACGLLLLGINNKYSSIANRIRLLNDERRRYINKIKEGKELDFIEMTRYASLRQQLNHLFNRLELVRNCVISYSLAIFLFILTSFLIGLEFFFDLKIATILMTVTFTLGMLTVGTGILFALLETTQGFKVIEIEIKAEE